MGPGISSEVVYHPEPAAKPKDLHNLQVCVWPFDFSGNQEPKVPPNPEQSEGKALTLKLQQGFQNK